MDLCSLSVERADEFFATLKLTEFQEKIAHELIKEILRQKEAAMKAFDDKLAKLGHDGEHTKRSHHPKHGDDKKPE